MRIGTRRLSSSRLVLLLPLAAALFIALPTSQAEASEIGNSRKFGLGGVLGDPTGITLKYFFTPKHAINAALGVGWWGGQNFHLHCDYNYNFTLTRAADFDLILWIGAGLKFFVYYHDYHPYWYDNTHDYGRVGLGLRVPIGLAFHLNRVPLEIFLEIAPGFAFLPWLDAIVDGGIGVRYYF